VAALKDRIAADLKAAMKSRDQVRLNTLRSALSGFTYKRSEAGQDLSERDELDVVSRLVKQRIDSATEFDKAGRTDLADKERAEREILIGYLPAQKSPEEIRTAVRAAIAGLPEASRNVGLVMKSVLPGLRGEADGNTVRQIVGEELNAS
jgi:uncharacterized protein YqeY